MSTYQAELEHAVAMWQAEGLPRPDVFLVAGSGVAGDFGEQVMAPRPLTDVLPFEAAGIAGHALSYELLRVNVAGDGSQEAAATEGGTAGVDPAELGTASDRVILCCRGRLHAYQGFCANQVVFAVRFAALLGARVAVVTNASGGLYQGVCAGDLALITDHINLTGCNPLCGSLPAHWGPQFPDMSSAYDEELARLALKHAGRLDLDLHQAVYLGVLGPSYETPAEIRAFQTMGAGLVGMSTVLEVIAARHMGLRCLGLSLVTNPGAGIGGDSLDHGDVLEIGKRAVSRVQKLLGAVLQDPALLK